MGLPNNVIIDCSTRPRKNNPHNHSRTKNHLGKNIVPKGNWKKSYIEIIRNVKPDVIDQVVSDCLFK